MSIHWPVLLQWLWAMLVGLGISISAAGWGSLVTRLARWREDSAAISAVFGLAVLILIGALLNLTHLVSRFTCIASLFPGLVLAAKAAPGWWRIARPQSSPWRSPMAWIAAGLLAFHFAGWAWNPDFCPHDDFHAYLVHPRKMLELGWMGEDPFAHRRVAGTFGGMFFLHAIVLTLCSEPSVHLIDPALPYLLLSGVILDVVRSRRLPAPTGAWLICAICLTAIPRLNISCLLLGACFFFVLFLWIDERSGSTDGSPPEAAAVGLLLGSLLSLKHNFTPAVGTAVAVWFALRCSNRNARPAVPRLAATLLGTTFLTLLPWCLASLQGTGTLWFPWLGRGVDISAQGPAHNFQAAITAQGTAYAAARFAMVPAAVALALGTFWHFRRRPAHPDLPAVGIAAAAWIAGIAAAIATEGYSPNRFTFAFTYPALLLLVLRVLTPTGPPQALPTQPRTRNAVAAALLLLPLAATFRNKFVEYNRPYAGFPHVVANRPLDDAPRRESYQRILADLPDEGGTLLFLDRMYLARLEARGTWIFDYPGNAAPRAGMPLSGDPDESERYLVRCGVRRIAYSYRNQGGLGPYLPALIENPARLLREQAQHATPWIQALDALFQSRPRIRDDGSNAVIELRLPR